jgi:L-asparaginase/Glu-tRNA(Gln) amidotransferase subunit D
VFTPNIGDADLLALGAIGAGGLSAQKARLAVMVALGSTDRRDDAISFIHQYALTFDARDRSTTA